MRRVLLLLCLSYCGLSSAVESPQNDELSELKQQLYALQKELAELKSLIKTNKDRGITIDATRDLQLASGKQILISAADKLSLQAGKASIVLSKYGDIQINGRTIEITATNDVQVKSSGHVVLKGSKLKQN